MQTSPRDRGSYEAVPETARDDSVEKEKEATEEFERELLADVGCGCYADEYNTSLKIEHWDNYGNEEDNDVFSYHHVRIAGDGGMRDVKRLLYGMQWYYAASRLIGVLVNSYAIALVDIPAVSKWPVSSNGLFNVTLAEENHSVDVARQEEQFLVTAHIACRLAQCDVTGAGDMESRFHVLLPIFELLYLLWNVFAFFGCGLIAACAPCLESCVSTRTDLLRWSYVDLCFWNYFNELRAYSSMKLIYYVTPTVFATQAYTRVVHAVESDSTFQSFLMILSFLFSRLLCLIIGFDSFLVKFRLTATYIQRGHMDSSCLLVAATFLFQTLGAVKINTFVRERLFIFIFGGDDGQLNHDEKLLVDVWNALIARRIYQHFGVLKGTIVMLGFDDYDFQMLVLEDDDQDAYEFQELELEKKRSEQLLASSKDD